MSGVSGAGRIRKDVASFRKALGDEVGRELARAVNEPIRKLRRATDLRIEEGFPKRYAAVFGPAFRIKVSATSGSASLRVKLVGTAKGKARIRDSDALNRGILRHKTYGHLPWRTQSVRPGFWDAPAAAAAGDVREAAEAAVEKAAKTIEGGL